MWRSQFIETLKDNKCEECTEVIVGRHWTQFVKATLVPFCSPRLNAKPMKNPHHHNTIKQTSCAPSFQQFSFVAFNGRGTVLYCSPAVSVSISLLEDTVRVGALLSTRNCSLKKLDCFTDPTGQIMIYHPLKDHISTLNPQ